MHRFDLELIHPQNQKAAHQIRLGTNYEYKLIEVTNKY